MNVVFGVSNEKSKDNLYECIESTITLPAFYHEFHSLIGYATHFVLNN